MISDSDLASHAGAVDDDLLADLIHLDDDDDDDDHDSTSASGSSHGDEEDETDSDSFELADDQVSAIELDDILDDLDAELTSYAASSAGTTTTSRSTATSTSNRRSLMAAAAEPARKRQRIQTQRSTDTL